VIYMQELERAITRLGLEHRRQAVLYDKRNLMPLCRRHHGAHHSGMYRIPLAVVRAACPKIDQFAGELGLSWFLDRYYP
jgi:hypothetical protein